MKPKSLSLFDKTSLTVFQQLNGKWEEVVERLGNLRLKGNEQIYLATVGSKEYLANLLMPPRRYAGIENLKYNERLGLFRLSRRFGLDKQHRVTGEFLVARTDLEYISVIVAVCESRFWRQGILKFVETLYPKAAFPFLTQGELQRLLKHVQKSISPVGLRVLELSSKKRLLGASRKKFESVREWTDADLDAVFEEARERNVWFRSVGFEFASEKDGRVLSTGTRAGISKYGYFYCNGDFDVFERTLVQDLRVFSSNRLKFFTGRDRATTVRHSPHPLQITYSVPIFRESDQGKRLVESMKKFKHGTCSVLHANPYIHLSVVDNKDFSSADLWVLAQDHILLVPQLRASAAALKRIVNHIFENFKEGQLSDYKEQQA